MPNGITQKVLNIFLASPSDLSKERTSIRNVVDSANKIIRELGWHIELYGWEDTLPGNRRPQTLINEDVDRCDLFIGMLWKRWGQPTGEYSSGFEEEFNRAIKRNLDSGFPEIWLFFKKVDHTLLNDKGKQLNKVLKFRKKQEDIKERFYKEFESPNELRETTLELLLKYIIKEDKQSSALSEQATSHIEGSRPQVSEESAMEILHSEDKQLIHNQLIELMKIATHAIYSGNFSFSLSTDKHDEAFNIIRFYLIGCALVSQRHTNDLIPTHEINLLYLYKEKLEAIPMELALIFRTLVANSTDVIPGWYWFKHNKIYDIHNILFYHAITDNDENVRMNCIVFLRDAKIRPNKEWFERFSSFFGDLNPLEQLFKKNDTLKTLVLSYISEIGILDDVVLIDQISKSEDKSTYPHFISAKLSIISRKSPNEALDFLLSLPSDLISKSMISTLEKISGNLDTPLLLKALKHYNSQIRLLALIELDKRREITQDVARSLLETSNIETKALLYKILIEQGWKPTADVIRKEFTESLDAQDEILNYIYSSYSDMDLKNSLDWYNIDVHIIYKILIIRNYDNMRCKILNDLDNNFENFRRESQEKLKQKYGENSKTIIDAWDKSEVIKDYILTKLTRSALSAIMEHDDPESLRIARKYIKNEHEDIKKLAINIMKKLGDTSDASLLVDTCMNSYGDLKKLAANAALTLNPGLTGTPSLFLRLEDEYLINLALEFLKNEPIEKTRGIVENLLQNSNDSIRKHAVYYLANKLSREELEKLLTDYPKNNHYYYNVICWIDRVLYAPQPLNELFRENLKGKSK